MFYTKIFRIFAVKYITKIWNDILNVMPKKKNPNNNYFNEKVEEAIHQFNISEDSIERNKLFSIIYPALAKICQVWRNKIKPTYVNLPDDELEADCLTFLLEKLPMIKAGKGKAFSYLTVTARNYYILANQNGYRKRLRGYSLEAMPEHFDVEENQSDRVEQMEWNGTLYDTFIEYMESNFEEMFTQSTQKIFGRILLDKIKSGGLFEDFNKRQFLNEIAMDSGIERGRVTKQVNRVAAFYSSFKEYYEKYGVTPQFKEKLYLTEEDKEYIHKHYKHYSKHKGVNGISRILGIKYEVVRSYVKSL